MNNSEQKAEEYSPQALETKWQEYWDKNKTFKTPIKPGAKKYYCLDFFPYPSGAGLHIGHPLGYTATDIYSRYKRMQGFSVLHPMGYDAFGLPAEQHAISTGEHPGTLTEKNCERFTFQMKKIGLSYDWDREIASCRVDYYKWTQWIFLKLYNSYFDKETKTAKPIEDLKIPAAINAKGDKAVKAYKASLRLAYYEDAMVNWCPALGTVLSNEEVIDGKSERGGHDVIRKPMKQWILRITEYADRLIEELDEIDWPLAIKEQQRNWIGKRFGTEVDFQVKTKGDSKQKISCFTTRADTLFGVTFFVISPEHPLVENFTTKEQRAAVKKYCEDSKKLSEFTRTLENREKTGVFSGGYVVNPINGEEVPVYIADYVLMSYGTGAVMGVPAHDERDFTFAKKFKIPIRAVVEPKDDKELSQKIKNNEVCYSDYGVMIATDFEIAKKLQLESMPAEEAKKTITNWLFDNKLGKSVITYKLRDWLFSRQRYWGEPMPIIHWEGPDGEITMEALSETDLPLKLPELSDYKPTETGESPLAKATDWVNVVCPKTGRKGRRETNIMPQWAGSCWYYLRFIDPHNDQKAWDPELEKAWMPVDLYVGGAEHAVLHLLYARFWHKVLFDLGYVSTKEPFKKLYNQGMIVAYAYKDKRGAIIPSDEVNETSDGKSIHKTTGEELERVTRKMSKSLKNVIDPLDIISEYGADTLRMYLMFMGPLDAMRPWDSKAIQGSHRFLRRAWTFVTKNINNDIASQSEEELKELTVAIKNVTEDIENLRMNTAISSLMEFLNKVSDIKVSKKTLETFILLLSPIAPHLCEELWQRLRKEKTLAYEAWPKYDEKYLQTSKVSLVIQVNGKKRGIIDVAVDIDDATLKRLVIKELNETSFSVKESDKFITVRLPKTGAPKLINVVS